MNAPTFKSHSVTCPICHRTSTLAPVGMYSGLFTCPHCHSNLVISWSGHYVRDPFAMNPLLVGKVLRRQSRPLARLHRDLGITKYLSIAAIVGSALCLGWLITTAPYREAPETFKNLWEWVYRTNSPSSPETSP